MTELQTGAVLRGSIQPPATLQAAEMSGCRMNAPLRILYVTPRFAPYMGGVESHVAQVAQRMVRAGAEVTVLTANPGGHLPAQETMDGVPVRRVRAYPADRDYYFAPSAFRVITRGEWDVVHVQSYHTLVAPLAMFAALSADVPYIVTFHGGGHSSSLRNAARGYQRRLLRPLLARATNLVAVANFERDLFQEQLDLPLEKFVTIPNGCDLPEFVKGDQLAGDQGSHIPVARNEASNDTTWIASIGRLEPYKGHQQVLAALPFVLKQKPNVRLWIAGAGPYEAALREQIEVLGLTEHVRLEAIPPQERSRMAQELTRVALVVLLSDFETHPIAILEALSLGRPALVTQTSGLQELVERGLACGVPLNSPPQQVANAIVEQLDHPYVPSSLNLPTWDDCAAELLQLYQTVVKRKQCAF